MAKPMKRANGTGAIVKVSGKKRRKPYQVIITLGWDDQGKQIRKSLGYYETQDKATIALANYNENPYDMRISELLNLKKENCHMDELYVDIIAAKTTNGIRRVPIANKTLEYWKYFYDKPDCEYLISIEGRDFSEKKGYTAFNDSYWKPLTEALEFGKRDLHETRHTTETMLKIAEVSESKINAIIGHAPGSTADKYYTHFPIIVLLEAINKI